MSPSEQNLKVCRRDEKVWRPDGQTNEQQKSYIPQSFFGGGTQILSKINFRNLKKSPSKKISGINKIWYGTYFYTPRYPAGGGYIVYVRVSVSASLTAYAIPP